MFGITFVFPSYSWHCWSMPWSTTLLELMPGTALISLLFLQSGHKYSMKYGRDSENIFTIKDENIVNLLRAFEQRKLLAAREVNGREELDHRAQGKVGRHRERAPPLHLAVGAGHPWYGDGLWDQEEPWHHSFQHHPAKKSVETLYS